MRRAPAVALDLAGAAPWRCAHALLAAAAATGSLAVVLQHAHASPAPLGATLATAAMAAAWAAWRWTPFRNGRLRFDGERWWFVACADAPEAPGLLHLMIDLGDRMLLRFDPDPTSLPHRPSPVWLPVGRLPAGGAVALRAAVYCRRLKPDQPPSGESQSR